MRKVHRFIRTAALAALVAAGLVSLGSGAAFAATPVHVVAPADTTWTA